jgi:O-antigen ligase
VIAPFVTSRGVLRSFGLSWAVFDELAMLALPIGLSFYLWSETRGRRLYLVGSGMILAALVATQSRAPILFGLIASALVLWLSYVRSRRMGRVDAHRGDSGAPVAMGKPVSRRIRTVVLVSIGLAVLVLALFPELLVNVVHRFERLLTLSPGGTFAIRLVLWKWALTAFWDNPILGVGPGMFRSLSELYPSLHLTPLHYYVRHLSAHNLTLHYLAETGLLGVGALLALFINQFRMARRGWRRETTGGQSHVGLAIYVLGILFLAITLVEAGWMWGQTGFIMVFFLTMITRHYHAVTAA